MTPDLPTGVLAARDRARQVGFELSCEPGVGALLSALAAATPEGGRILELGTGVGAGLAWIVAGLGDRTDCEVVTVDVDAGLQAVTQQAGWPSCVEFRIGDGAALLRELGTWDLIFADAPGGKLDGLDASIQALRPRGVLLVDDMDLRLHDDPDLRAALTRVRADLLADDRLFSSELDLASGIILSVRQS